MVRYNNSRRFETIGELKLKLFGELKIVVFLAKLVCFIYLCGQWYIYLSTLVLLNVLMETFSCVYSEIVFTIISFIQKLIKWGDWNKSGDGKFFKNL